MNLRNVYYTSMYHRVRVVAVMSTYYGFRNMRLSSYFATRERVNNSATLIVCPVGNYYCTRVRVHTRYPQRYTMYLAVINIRARWIIEPFLQSNTTRNNRGQQITKRSRT